MTRTTNLLRAALLLALSSFTLNGCFVFIDDVDDEPVDERPPVIVNYEPEILGDETWWLCDYSATVDDYFFEFQAVVEDFDGPRDVEFVDVTVYEAGYDYVIDSFTLLYEGDAIWGGLVWEHESALYCGDPVDVMFETWDAHGGVDRFVLMY